MLYLRALSALLIRETAALSGFKSFVQVSHNTLPRTSISPKPLKIIAGGVSLDVGNGLEHVADVNSRIFLHQNTGSASRSVGPPGRVSRRGGGALMRAQARQW